MTRPLRALVAVLLALVISACSGPTPTSPTPPPPTASGPPVVAPAPEPTTPPGVSSVSWDELPGLTQAGRQFVTDHNLNRYGERGVVKRWEASRLSIYVTPDIDRKEVDRALRFWESVMRGNLTFQIVEQPGEAHIVLDTAWNPPAEAPPNTCGEARVTKMERNVMLSGVAHFNKSRCGVYAEIIAHEIGHLIGPSGGHTERGTVMSNEFVELKSTPLIDEVYNWLPRVPAGTRPM